MSKTRTEAASATPAQEATSSADRLPADDELRRAEETSSPDRLSAGEELRRAGRTTAAVTKIYLGYKGLSLFDRGVLRSELVAENLALRQQLAVLQRSVKRPKLTAADRVFWAFIFRR